MRALRRTFGAAIVWAMIPLTLVAAAPRMECQCAKAQGKRWCECCFHRKTDSASPHGQSVRACCQTAHRSNSRENAGSAKCPTCGFTNPTTGSCCVWKTADAPTLSKHVIPPDHDVAVTWLIAPVVESLLPAARAHHDEVLRISLLPPPDRVILFENLVI